MVAQTKKRDRLQSENHHDDKEDYDDDEEMEFEDDTSTISTAVVAKVEEPVKARLSNQTQFSPELLSQYYSRLFPFTLLTKWLSYNPSINNVNKGNNGSKLLSHREFSFTIEPFPGDEIYIRYQSFKSQKEFENAVTKRQPRKIDIGAIFSHPPKDHHAIQNSTSGRKFQPNQRELVFDIDLTDYDGVRKCGCSGAKICNICWKMMNMAVKVMDEGLREDFGFQHICWFYSGRRGVHCWVCDESARTLSDSGRSAVANYFEVGNIDNCITGTYLPNAVT
jgi:DNA primase small subunit